MKSNLDKIKSNYLKWNPFMSDRFLDLLTDMMAFAEKYPKCMDDETKKDIIEKLSLVKRYTSLEDALYSEFPDCVENACDELCRNYRDGKFNENKKCY